MWLSAHDVKHCSFNVQTNDAGAITLGILLTLASQVFQAVRLIMEESLLKKMDLHPMEVCSNAHVAFDKNLFHNQCTPS